jgi:hypothetical protein
MYTLIRNTQRGKTSRNHSIFPKIGRSTRKLLKIASMVGVFWGFAEVAEFKSV